MDATATSQPTFPAGHPFTGFPTSGGAGGILFWSDTVVTGQTGQHYCPGYGRRLNGSVTGFFGSCIDEQANAYLFCVRAPGNTGP
jgi:hypothetical protein